MKTIAIQEYQTAFGVLVLGSFEEKLCLCDWKYRKQRTSIDERIKKGLDADFETKNSDVIEKTITQLEEYFIQKRTVFDVPLEFVGTNFQKNVWEALQKIPYGTTNSYLQLANNLCNPLAIRAIASANGANALAIIVPCHRIIGSNGDLVGYAGGLNAKKKLLTLENSSQTSLEFE